MSPVDLRPDCSRCQALCCAAPAFDKSDEFAIDKPAYAPCPHLGGDDRCRIHDRLAKSGFRGCVLYDCLGAGQRVVQELYPGRSWREEPELLDEMWRALTALRGVHELILLLGAAAKLPLSAEERRTLEGLLGELEPGGGWTQNALHHWWRGRVPVETREFLKSLQRYFRR